MHQATGRPPAPGNRATDEERSRDARRGLDRLSIAKMCASIYSESIDSTGVFKFPHRKCHTDRSTLKRKIICAALVIKYNKDERNKKKSKQKILA